MAITQVADAIVKIKWLAEEFLSVNSKLNIVNSNLIRGDQRIKALVSNADMGLKLQVPYVKQAAWVAANISNDSDTRAVAKKMEKTKGYAAVTFLNNAWAEYDMTPIAGSGINTIDFAKSQFSFYANSEVQERMLSIMSGVIASNIANEGSDSVLVDKVNSFSYDLAVDTLGLTGDYMDAFDTIVMHSSTARRIRKEDINALTTSFDKALNKDVTFYYDMKVIVNDKMTTVVDAVDGDRVQTIFIKEGSFILEPINAQVPVAVDVDNSIGNGGGSTTIWQRFGFLLHLNGFSYTGTPADLSPSIAELADPTAWDRLVNQKLTPFVTLESLK